MNNNISPEPDTIEINEPKALAVSEKHKEVAPTTPPVYSSSGDSIMLGLGVTIGLMIVAGSGFGISTHLGSENREKALTSAAAEIGQEFGEWSAGNTDLIAGIEGRELSYDQFTQKIGNNIERKSVVEEATYTYSAGDNGTYEICVTSTTARTPDFYIYSSETNMVASTQKCN